MAIFLVMAWAVQLGEYVGIVKTVPQTSDGRAYEKAQKGAQWLRYHLANITVVDVQEHQLEIVTVGPDGPQNSAQRIDFVGQCLRMSSNQGARNSNLVDHHFSLPEEQPDFDLGPQSWVKFQRHGQSVTILVQAGDDSLGDLALHQTRLHLPNCYHPVPKDTPATNQ